MAEQAVYEQINAITALDGRVYHLVLPQDVRYPAVTYQRISSERNNALKRDAKTRPATFQVDIYGRREAGSTEFTQLADSVIAALDRQKSGDAVGMFIESDRDDYEKDTELLRKSVDVRVWYRVA